MGNLGIQNAQQIEVLLASKLGFVNTSCFTACRRLLANFPRQDSLKRSVKKVQNWYGRLQNGGTLHHDPQLSWRLCLYQKWFGLGMVSEVPIERQQQVPEMRETGKTAAILRKQSGSYEPMSIFLVRPKAWIFLKDCSIVLDGIPTQNPICPASISPYYP